jgi:hypothetical protein
MLPCAFSLFLCTHFDKHILHCEMLTILCSSTCAIYLFNQHTVTYQIFETSEHTGKYIAKLSTLPNSAHRKNFQIACATQAHCQSDSTQYILQTQYMVHLPNWFSHLSRWATTTPSSKPIRTLTRTETSNTICNFLLLDSGFGSLIWLTMTC